MKNIDLIKNASKVPQLETQLAEKPTIVSSIEKLKAELTAGKSFVIIKNGSILDVSAEIMIPAGTTILAKGAKMRRANGYEGRMIRLAKDCQLLGLTIDGNRTAMVNPTWDKTIEIATPEGRCTIEDVVIINGNEGVLVYGNDVVVNHCYFENMGGNAIHFSGSGHTVVENCTVIGANKKAGMGHEDGCIIWSNLCENITCVNNYLEDGLNGFGSLDSTDNSNVTIANNTIVNMRQYAIDLVVPADTAPLNIVINGNRIYNSGYIRIYNVSATPTVTVEYVSVSNNILVDSLIGLQYVNNIIVSGNIIKKSVIDTNTNTAGVGITGCKNIIVSGNVIENFKYSIYPSNSFPITISDNICKNFYQYGLNLASSVNVIASNNTFINDSASLASVTGIIPIVVGKNCSAIANTISMNNCLRGMQINTGGKAFNNRIITASGTPSILIGGGETNVVAKFNIIDQPITNSAGAAADVTDNYTAVA